MRTVQGSEILSRFLFDEHIRADGTIRYNAFMVAPRQKCSVFRTSGLEENLIQEIAAVVASSRNRQLKGRGELLAQQVMNLELSVEPNEPPQHHADIILPSDREQQKVLALKLAEAATYINS